MANTFVPFGFRPFGRLDGGAPTAGLQRFFIASSDPNLYFTGDVVSLSSAGGVGGVIGTGNQNVLSLTSATSGYIPTGVFAGCEFFSPSVSRQVWQSFFPGNVASSALVIAYVITDPDQLFIAQASTTGGVVGTSNVGWGVGIASSGQASGNQTTGVSNIALASSNMSLQSSTSPFRVVDVYQNYAPPGVNGTSSGSEGGAVLVVSPNNWIRRNLQSAST